MDLIYCPVCKCLTNCIVQRDIFHIEAIFRRNTMHFILPYAIVICVCVRMCVSVCVCRICGPQENGLRQRRRSF